MKRDAILSLLAPTVGGLLPTGAPPQALALLMDHLGGRVNDREPPAAVWGNPTPVSDLQQLVKNMARRREGWGGKQWGALEELISRESGWDPNADNPTSTAHGLFQFLDSTRQNYGVTTNSPLRKQVRAGLNYIDDRYDSPAAALRFHDRMNWY
jgi:hypothetical protein